jgi:hypothetical protein
MRPADCPVVDSVPEVRVVAYVGLVASKYEVLTTFLVERSEPVVEVTFAELDRMVGGLPTSARNHAAWWANSRTGQPHARYWLDAKRRATPDFNGERVRFEVGVETSPSARAPRPGAAPTLTATGETVEASVRFEWLAAGHVVVDASGKPMFPSVPARPGVYRFALANSDGSSLGIYIGESDNLLRRMGNYRNPGPTQPTNQRMNARFIEVLREDGLVAVAIAVEVTVDGDTLDLAAKPARLLAENAALVRAHQAGLLVENL